MALTKQQIAYGAVLVTAVAAFIWDRAAQGPAPAGAAAPAPVASAVKSQPMRIDAGEPGALGEQLQALARTQQLDLNAVDNAFALAPSWPRKQDSGNSNAATRPTEEAVLADAFVKGHKLDAVMVRLRGGLVMLDGKALLVGQSIDKFKLVSVTRTTATFAHGETRVVLRLAADGKPGPDGGEPGDGSNH